MTEKLVEQIVHALTAGGDYEGCEDIVSFVVKDTLRWLQETQIVSYAFIEPDGGGSASYVDLDDLATDLFYWSRKYPQVFPIHMQIEMREPAFLINVSNAHGAELIQ